MAVNVFVGVNFVIKKAGKQGDLFAVNVLTFTTCIDLCRYTVVWRK